MIRSYYEDLLLYDPILCCKILTAMIYNPIHAERDKNTLREFYFAIATLAAHEYFAFGCDSLFAQIRMWPVPASFIREAFR